MPQTPEPHPHAAQLLSLSDVVVEFAQLLARMSPGQKDFMAKCFIEYEQGRCTFDEAISKLESGFGKVAS